MMFKKKNNHRSTRGSGRTLQQKIISKIGLTVLITTMALLGARAWYAKSEWWKFGSFADKVVIQEKGAVEVCVGGESLLLSRIKIDEGQKNDFMYNASQTTAKRLNIVIDNSDFEFDVSKYIVNGGTINLENEVVNISGNASIVPLNVAITANSISFDYKFEDYSILSTSFTNSITINNLYVKALSSATNTTAKLRVQSGAGLIDGLDGDFAVGVGNGTILADLSLDLIPGATRGTNEMQEGNTETFTTDEITNATSYEWDIPAELNGGIAEVRETTNRTIDLTAVQVTTPITVQLKARGKNAGCTGKYTATFDVTIKPAGLSVTPATATFCKVADVAQNFSSIIIQENAEFDFKGIGSITLELSNSTDFTLGGSLGVLLDDAAAPSSFGAIVQGDNTLKINYDFRSRNTINKLEITGLTITPSASATATSVTLRPKSLAGVNWNKVFTNTDFGLVTMNSVPTTATQIGLVAVGADRYRLIAQGIQGATSYNWTLPSGINPAGVINTDQIIVTDDRAAGDKSTPIDLKVKGTSTCGNGGEFTSNVTLNDDIEVTFRNLDPLCVGGEPSLLLSSIVCEEKVEGSLNNGTVTMEINPSGYELIVAPKVAVNGTALSGVTLLPSRNGFSFNLVTTATLDRIVINGLVVKATNATTSNQQAVLSSSTLSAGGNLLTLANFERFDQPTAPEFLGFPTIVCKNTSGVNLSVKTTPGVTYDWTLPSGVTLVSKSANGDKVEVNIGAGFTGGDISVVASLGGCSSEATTRKLVVPETPTKAVIITGKTDLYVGEEATYEVLGIQNASRYEWVIPAEMERVGSASNITNTSTITLKALTTSVSVNLSVRGINTCNETGVSSNNLPIAIKTSQIEFVPNTINDVCAGTINNKSVDVTLKETFQKDFSGSGTLVLRPAGAFTLKDNSSLSVSRSDVNSSSLSAKVVSGELLIDYDFRADNATNLGSITINGVEVSFNNTSTVTQLAFTASGSTLPLANDKVFALIGNVLSFATNGVGITASHTTLCQGSGDTYTFTVDNIGGASTYDWDLPSGLRIVSGANTNSITVELQSSAIDNIGSIVKVKGENGGCSSIEISSDPIQIFTNFTSTISPVFSVAPASICNIGSDIKVLEVDKITDVNQYQWVLPAGLISTTEDEDGVDDGILTTSGRQITLKVGSSLTGGNQSLDIKVKGIKQNGCGIATNESTHTIQVYSPELTLNIPDNKAYTVNADREELIPTPTGGTFSIRNTLDDSPSAGVELEVGRYYFAPQVAGEGTKTITYTYTDPTSGCAFSKEITVNVTQFTTGCFAPDGSFSLKVKQNSKQVLYAVLSGQNINGVGGSRVTSPIVTCPAGAQKPADIADNAEYEYTFTGTIPTVKTTIQAIFLTFDDAGNCLTAKASPVDIYPQPVAPTITGNTSLCEAGQATFEVGNHNPNYDYTWSLVNVNARFVTTPGDTDGADDKGKVVTIEGVTAGTVGLTVTAIEKNANGCSTPFTATITVTKPFDVALEETASVCATTVGVTKTYTPKLTQGGVAIADLTGYTFNWEFTQSGATTPEVKTGATASYQWTTEGTGNVRLTVNAPAGQPTCEVSKDFTVNVSDFVKPTIRATIPAENKNLLEVCEADEVTYQIAGSADRKRFSWTVTGGEITSGTTPSPTIDKRKIIKIKWNDSGEQTITINKKTGALLAGATDLGCNDVTQIIKVKVNPRPVLNFADNTSIYCNGGSDVWILPKINDDGTELTESVIRNHMTNPSGRIQFFRITKDFFGNDVESGFTNPFTPSSLSLGESYKIFYRYTSAAGCTYDSPFKTFSLEDPPSVEFDIAATGASVNVSTVEEGAIGSKEKIIQVCSEDPADGTLLRLTPKITSGGTTIDDTKEALWEIRDAADNLVRELPKPATNPNTHFSFTYQYLAGKVKDDDGIGEYTVTYTYYIDKESDCKATYTQRLRLLKTSRKINVQVLSPPARYCVNDVQDYVLEETGFGASVAQTGFFKIRKVLGANADPLGSFTTLTNPVFNPNNPMQVANPPGEDASTDLRNEVAGKYEIVYEYQYGGASCAFDSEPLTITIEALPKLSILGLESEYCDNAGTIAFSVVNDEKDLQTNIVTQTVVATNMEYEKEGLWTSVPENNPVKLGVGDYKVRVTHTNLVGCDNSSEVRNISIVPQPTDLKVLVRKVYNEDKIYLKATANNIGVDGTWEWNINGIIKTGQEPVLESSIGETDNIGYSLNANTGKCDATIKKDFKLDFDVEGFCAGGITSVTNKSVLRNAIGNDEIGEVSWRITDQDDNLIQTLNGATANYSFTTSGEYWITLVVANTDKSAIYELKRRVDIFEVITVDRTRNYTEDFENAPKSWVSRGLVTQGLKLVDQTSWKMKPLANGANDIIKGTEGTVWMTDNGNETHYNNNEQSYVETPCFDISDLNKPMVSLRYWAHTDEGADGVVLLYTTDDGKTWKRVGQKTPEIKGWFNANGILGAPGKTSSLNNQEANEGNQGWTGTDSAWVNTAYSLDDVRLELLAKKKSIVRFRIAFGSNSDNPNGQYEGFAFDNFSISNRNRTLLLEYFTNTNIANAEVFDKEASFFPYDETVGNSNTEIISIHHHVSFPDNDEFNLANPKDASGRAFFHGVKEGPLAVIDGIDVSKDPKNEVSDLFFKQRVLKVAPFNISIDPATITGKKMDIKAKITAIEDFSKGIVMQVVIIEDKVESQDKTYHNVMRKMLPDAAGTYHKQDWKPGDTYDLNLSWDMGDLAMKSFRVVVFIEDYITKEVHQAAVSTTQVLRQHEGQAAQGVTGVDKRIVKNGIILYPNPATIDVKLELKPNQQLKSNAVWEISNINGQVVGSGVWQQRQRSMQVNIAHLAEGIYLFRVFDANRVFLLRFKKR